MPAMTIPPMAGPRLRARLNPIELSAIADDSRDTGTWSRNDACHVGELIAVPAPIRKVRPSRVNGVTWPNAESRVRTALTASIMHCADSITRRRSNVSAAAPAKRARSRIGMVVDDCTRATIWAESVSNVINQAAPTA